MDASQSDSPEPAPKKKLQSAILTSPKAEELAEIGGVLHDLEFAIATCTSLIAVLNRKNEGETTAQAKGNDFLVRALYTAALVTYVRCFTSGKRIKLDPDKIFSSAKGAIDLHNYYKNMRDKHIAHSVNPFEETSIAAVLSDPEIKPRRVLQVSLMTVMRVSELADGIVRFRDLMKLAFELTKMRGNALSAEVLAEARALDIDELSKRVGQAYKVPGPESAGSSRAKAKGE
jgi:hypothetical protein